MRNCENISKDQSNHYLLIRYAKMWKKGVSFTTNDRGTTFLLDAGGPKTTVDWFLSMDEELILKTFYLLEIIQM